MARFRTLIAWRKTISGWKIWYHLRKYCHAMVWCTIYVSNAGVIQNSAYTYIIYQIVTCYFRMIWKFKMSSNNYFKITFIYYKHINIENIDNNQSWLIVYIKERATLLQMYTSLVNKRWYQEDSATPTRLKTLIMYCNINKPCL